MIDVPYLKAGCRIRNFLEKHGYLIEDAIEIGSTKETTIFNEKDKKGLIISQDIKKDDIPENITFYKGGFGLKVPELEIFSITSQMERTNIKTNTNNYYLMNDARHIDNYKELINERNVIFYYYEPLKKKKSMDNSISYLYGDKEYQKETINVPRYGQETFMLTIYYPTGRILTNKSGRAK